MIRGKKLPTFETLKLYDRLTVSKVSLQLLGGRRGVEEQGEPGSPGEPPAASCSRDHEVALSSRVWGAESQKGQIQHLQR